MNHTNQRLARLRTIEGHIRGVARMIEADAYCIDSMKQTHAIARALDKFNSVVLEHHLAHCVTAAIRSEDEHERERVVGELVQVFAPPTTEAESDMPLARHAQLQAIEAAVRNVAQLVERDAYCIEIIREAQSVKQSLAAFSTGILADHLNGCVTTAIRGDAAAERERKLRELLTVFNATNQLSA